MSIKGSLLKETGTSATVTPNVKSCLSEVDLFSQVPAEELLELNKMLPLSSFPSGAIVYDPQGEKEVLFIVKRGRVRVFQVSPSGKSFTLAVYGVGDVFGNMPLLGQVMGNSYAETIESSDLCSLSTRQVKNNFLTDPRISGQLAVILSQRVAELEGRLSDMALRPLNQRVASLLLSTAVKSYKPWNRYKTVKLTHEQIANLAGASREAVSKALAELVAQGYIVQHRGSISIVAWESLKLFKDGFDE